MIKKSVSGNNNTLDCVFLGNIIPQNWYNNITTEAGRPDLTAITILSEIIYWYRPSNKNLPKFTGDLWQTSYGHFESKFNYNKERIRRAFVRLEHLNLIRRELRTVTLKGQRFNNVLFIHLNWPTLHKTVNPSPQICGDIYIELDYKENNIKNRYLDKDSSDSENIFSDNLDNNDKPNKLENSISVPISIEFDSNSNSKNSLPDTQSDQSKQTSPLKFRAETPLSNSFSKSIKELLPLVLEETTFLTNRVGREFGSTFINALASKLGDKYPDHSFKSREAFLKYIAKALEHEKHDPAMVNNINFTYTSLDEQFLERIESSGDLSDIGKIKRRIAQEFESSVAVEILKKCYFPKLLLGKQGMRDYKVYINDDTLKLEDHTKAKLEKIIIETTQRLSSETGLIIALEEIIFAPGRRFIDDKSSNSNNSSHNHTHSSPIDNNGLKLSVCENPTLMQVDDNASIDPIWARVRQRLKQIYGPEVDRSWFSKIKFEFVEEQGRVYLNFQTKFMDDWFRTHYSDKVCSTIAPMILGLREIVTKIDGSDTQDYAWRESWFNKEGSNIKDFKIDPAIIANLAMNKSLSFTD